MSLAFDKLVNSRVTRYNGPGDGQPYHRDPRVLPRRRRPRRQPPQTTPNLSRYPGFNGPSRQD
jgi:hypothetical protein